MLLLLCFTRCVDVTLGVFVLWCAALLGNIDGVNHVKALQTHQSCDGDDCAVVPRSELLVAADNFANNTAFIQVL